MLKLGYRKQDLVFRYGGDEFIVLFDGLKLENAETIANNLINNVHNVEDFCKEDVVKISISIGISSFNKDDEGITRCAKPSG